MSYETNVYYAPEASGLEQLDVLDQDNMSYEYNTLVAWKHGESKRVFWTSDSGCSCPTPFEDYFFRGPDDTNLSELTKQNIAAFETKVKSWCESAQVEQSKREAFIDAAVKIIKRRRAGRV